jgi:hypothetical protein
MTAHAATNARAAASLRNGARAAASLANGAKSRGPKTTEGKARASRNALKHGLCAKKFLLLPGDSGARFDALESALLNDLSPQGALQTLLAHRLVAAAWRLQRADRAELELFCAHDSFERGLGGALVRDARDAKVFPTLVRYRGAAQTEFFRTLKALKDLQAEAARKDVAAEVQALRTLKPRQGPQAEAETTATGAAELEKTPRLTVVPPPARKDDTLCAKVDDSGSDATRNEPERRPSGHESGTMATPDEPETRPGDREAMRALRDAPEVGPPTHRGGGAETRNEPIGPAARAVGLDTALRAGAKQGIDCGAGPRPSFLPG